jgi:hypothetical protein
MSARVAVALSIAVLTLVLTGGFARLAGVAGVGTSTEPPTQTSEPRPEGVADGATTASGVLAPGDTDGTTPTPSPDPASTGPRATDPLSTENTTQPASPTTLPNTPTALPPMWPQTLPAPGQHTVVVHDIEPTPRWVLGLPGGLNLVGGRFLAELKDLGWETETVVTPSGITTVGSRNAERLSLVFRPGARDLPQGWSSLEVIYQPMMSDFEVPPTSTTTPEQSARKGA